MLADSDTLKARLPASRRSECGKGKESVIMSFRLVAATLIATIVARDHNTHHRGVNLS